MTGAPPASQAGRRARVRVLGGHQRSDGHEVVGVRGVTEPQEEREPQGDKERGALEQVGERLVEALDRVIEEVEAHDAVLAHSGHSPTIGK